MTLTAADFEMQRSGVRASDVTYSIEQPCAFTSFIDPHKGKEIARFTQVSSFIETSMMQIELLVGSDKWYTHAAPCYK